MTTPDIQAHGMAWTPVEAGLPALYMPVWLYEPGRGIWIGARGDAGDGWLWGSTNGSHYYAETTGGVGAWRFREIDVSHDYRPTFWMPLPMAPALNVADKRLDAAGGKSA